MVSETTIIFLDNLHSQHPCASGLSKLVWCVAFYLENINCLTAQQQCTSILLNHTTKIISKVIKTLVSWSESKSLSNSRQSDKGCASVLSW